MGGVSERMAVWGCRLFEEPTFKESYAGEGVSESYIAFEAAKFVLYGMFKVGEIDNFGTNPTIEELQGTIIKLTDRGEG